MRTVKCLVRVLCLSCFASRGRKCVAFVVREESLDEFAEIGRRCNGAAGGERQREPAHQEEQHHNREFDKGELCAFLQLNLQLVIAVPRGWTERCAASNFVTSHVQQEDGNPFFFLRPRGY